MNERQALSEWAHDVFVPWVWLMVVATNGYAAIGGSSQWAPPWMHLLIALGGVIQLTVFYVRRT